MDWNLSTSNLTDLIRQKQNDIRKQTENEILESANFQRMGNLLVSGRERINGGTEFRVVAIEEAQLEKLNENLDIDALYQNKAFLFNSFIKVDKNFAILDYSSEKIPANNEEARTLLLELSKEGLVCFEIYPNGRVNSFVQGEYFGDGIFFSQEEFLRFNERKPLSEIDTIFDEYRLALRVRHRYTKFFVPKTVLRLWYKNIVNKKTTITNFLNTHSQIVWNACEDLFRDDLKAYLQQNVDAELISKEAVTENERRLDIFIIDRVTTGLSIVEVKWLGQAINSSCSGYGTKYQVANIVPTAFNQTVDYIRQLSEEKKNIKMGYLVVFDARKGDNEPICDQINDNQWKKENKPYVHQFKKVKDFRVINQHPK